MLPATKVRVTQNTAEEVNERIRREAVERVMECARRGPAAIAARLAELDEEWDVERYLETMAPTITLAGLTLGLTVNRKWLILPVLVQSFFLQHALQGWCPPLPVLRRLGIRTAEEINAERYALKAYRGDFENLSEVPERPGTSRAREALAAAQA